MSKTLARASLLLTAALVLCLAPAIQAAPQVADVQYFPDGLYFDVLQDNEGLTLDVSGPVKYTNRLFFESGEEVTLPVRDSSGNSLRDGIYSFELRLIAKLDRSIRDELARARKTGDMTVVNQLCDEGRIPLFASLAAGSFTIFRGKIVDPYEEEESARAGLEAQPGPVSTHSSGSSGDGLTNVSALDFVINDDLIVDGSACIGFDCVNGEVFGFDTIRLKENNLRIKFEDTSVGSFPSTDWQLTANASASGGQNKFSIDDISGGRTPFTVEGNAPSHSLYVDDGGRVGFGTSTPVVDLHVKDGDSPTLRLEQDGSSGFAPQTWDVAGNETSFFVRDATNGSTLPFRIFPGQSSGALVLRNGRVGVGTTSPTEALHLRRTDGSARLLVEEAAAAEAARTVLSLKNNGRILLEMEDTSGDGRIWKFRTVEGQFNIDTDASPGNEVVITQAGNMTILGTLTENSNREAKTNIQAVNPDEVLQKVARLPLATWTYKKEQDVEHLGPMAQDFHEAFGLGASNVGITTYDTAGVALASVQALLTRLEKKEAELDALKTQNDDLLERLEALERKLQ